MSANKHSCVDVISAAVAVNGASTEKELYAYCKDHAYDYASCFIAALTTLMDTGMLVYCEDTEEFMAGVE